MSVKSIEMDRNLSKTLPRLELDAQFRDQILALVKESFQEGMLSSCPAG